MTQAERPRRTPSASEQLRLVYQTGQHDDPSVGPDNGEAFQGLQPPPTREEHRRLAGDRADRWNPT